MAYNSHTPTRRTVLRTIGAGTVGLSAVGSVSGQGTVRDNEPATYHETLRGSMRNPVSTHAIEDLRTGLVEEYTEDTNGAGNHAFQTLEENADEEILGYNVLIDDGGPREQFVSQAALVSNGGTLDSELAGEIEDDLQSAADEMLQDVLTTDVDEDSVGNSSAEIDWEDWDRITWVDHLFQFDKIDDNYPARPGRAEFDIELRGDEDQERASVRSFMRMTPGRVYCEEENKDDYCREGFGPGPDGMWHNQGAQIKHDWDLPSNSRSPQDIIQDWDPSDQLENETSSRSVSLGVGTDGGAQLGFTSSYNAPSSVLKDFTPDELGHTRWEWEISADSSGAEGNAAIETSSSGAVNLDNPGPSGRSLVIIDVDLIWGLPVPFTGVWSESHKEPKTFELELQGDSGGDPIR